MAARTNQKYSVVDYYTETGIFQRIARSQQFESFILGVTVLFAVWLSIEADFNAAVSLQDSEPIFIAIQMMFFIVFVFDVVVRLGAFKHKQHALRDLAFLHDFTLTLLFFVYILSGFLGSFDTSLMLVAQLSRLTTLLRKIPEALILAKGLVVASRSVFFTLCLEALITYIFANAFIRLTGNTKVTEHYFPSVPEAMHSLIMFGLFFDVQGISAALKEENLWLELLFFTYVILSFFMVVICAGVICEVVNAVAAKEKEALVLEWCASGLTDVMRTLGMNTEEGMSKSQVQEMMLSPQAAQFFQQAGVDAARVVDIACPHSDQEQEKVAFEDIVKAVVQVQSSANKATVQDVMQAKTAIVTTYQEKNNSPTLQDIQKAISDALQPLQKRLEDNDKVLMAALKLDSVSIPGGVNDLKVCS